MKAERPLATSYHVVVVVWGREYLDLFLNTCLPTQLGEGNVSALPPGSRYRILTRAADMDHVEAHPTVRALARVVPVDVVAMDALEHFDQSGEGGPISANGAPTDNRFALITECNRQAIRDAVDQGAALIFPSPDHVFSAGCFAAVVRRHREGYRAVVCTGLRLEKEGLLRAIDASGRRWSAPPPRDLVRMALPNLHTHTRSMFVDARAFNPYPLGVLWRVSEDGLLARCFHFFPLMLDPMNTRVMPKLTIDAGYVTQACPDFSRVHVVTDSDELVVFELTKAGGLFGCATGAGAALWRAAAMAARCDEFGIRYWHERPVFIHRGDLDEQWRDTEASAARFVRAVMWRTAPFGAPWPRWYRWIERTHHLRSRSRRAWRQNVPRVRTKQIVRAVRVAKSRANRMFKRTTRQLFGRAGVFSR